MPELAEPVPATTSHRSTNTRSRLSAAAVVTAAVRGLGLLSQVAVVGALGASLDLDAFFIALIVPGFIVAPLAGAIELAVAPEVAARGATRQDIGPLVRTLQGQFLKWAVPFGALLTALSPLLVRLSSPGASDRTHEIATLVAFVVYPSVVPRLLASVSSAALVGTDRFAMPVAVSAVTPLLMLGAALVPGLTPMRLAFASTVGAVAELVVLTRLCGPHTGKSTTVRPMSLKNRSATSLVVLLLLFQTGPVVDQAFVAGVDEGELARFALAVRMFDVCIAVVVVPVARLAQNRLAASYVQGMPTFRREIRRQMIRGLQAGVLASALLSLASPAVFRFLFVRGEFTVSDAWRTTHIAWGFAASALVIGIGFILPRVLIELKRTRVLISLVVCQVCLNGILDALVLKRFGAVGVAVVTGFTYAYFAVLQWWVVKSTFRRPPLGATAGATSGTS